MWHILGIGVDMCPPGGMHPSFYGPGMMGGGWIGHAIFALTFWVLAITLIVYLVKLITGNIKRGESALDILNKRYAKGEITKEEFERMKNEIAKG